MKHGGIEDPSSSRTTTTKPSETLVEEASTTFENEAISPTLKDAAAPEPEDSLVSPPPPAAFDQSHLFKALEVVERDSLAIAESFTSLFDSLRLALSESTSCTIDHMQCFSDAAGRVQEAAIEASARVVAKKDLEKECGYLGLSRQPSSSNYMNGKGEGGLGLVSLVPSSLAAQEKHWNGLGHLPF